MRLQPCKYHECPNNVKKPSSKIAGLVECASAINHQQMRLFSRVCHQILCTQKIPKVNKLFLTDSNGFKTFSERIISQPPPRNVSHGNSRDWNRFGVPSCAWVQNPGYTMCTECCLCTFLAVTNSFELIVHQKHTNIKYICSQNTRFRIHIYPQHHIIYIYVKNQ